MVNVIEQLEHLRKSRDQSSQLLKKNGLKFINSLCKEKNFLQNFVDLNGREFLENILYNDSVQELKETEYSLFKVNPYYIFKNKVITQVDDQDQINLETLNILNKLNKNNYQFDDYEDISNKIIGAVKYSIVNLGDLYLIMKYMLKQSKSFQTLSLQGR